ncbi:GNAT family N-acetyltransferase [Candidatus Bathyarchaeota archaeon]|nr:GNAT family N-acetyltransferase [Candidatus Bathyarchaeota archaeon]
MDKLSFRLANSGDIDFWMSLIEIVGWDNTLNDVKRSLFLEPEGCFIANINNKNVGIVNSYLYGKIGWIGNLIVKPEFRGRGIGKELMNHAINRLKLNGVESIRLDSVEKAVNLYNRIGFQHEFKSLRFICKSEKRDTRNVTLIKPSELNEIFRLDKKYCGYERQKFLKKIREEFPKLCYKISIEGKIQGYIMARFLNNSFKIGPWVCNPKYTIEAEELLFAVMKQAEGYELKVGILEPNKNAIDIVEKNSFIRLPSSYRMCLGNFKKLGKIEGIFGIGSPDKS